LAVDVKSGENVWSWPDDGPAYASPIVVVLADVEQIVTQTQKSCVGIRLSDGKLLWSIPYQTDYDQNSVTPLEHEGSIIFSGYGNGVDRYRIEQVDDQWEANNIWNNKEVSFYMSSGVIEGERLFGYSHRNKGQFFALDLTTGKTLWTGDGRQGENASLTRTGKAIWALTTEAELLVFKAADTEFELLARYRVAETPTWANPVLLSDGVLVKDETKLIRWQYPKAP
jgi:outer membrane protein assembly factor BamB